MSRPSSRRLILSGYSFAQAVCACAVQGSAVSCVPASGAVRRWPDQPKRKFQSQRKSFPTSLHIGNGHMRTPSITYSKPRLMS